jgi:hypothetical protein
VGASEGAVIVVAQPRDGGDDQASGKALAESARRQMDDSCPQDPAAQNAATGKAKQQAFVGRVMASRTMPTAISMP